MSPVQTDPFPDFVNNVDVADGDKVDARFKKLYDLQDPGQVGLDYANMKSNVMAQVQGFESRTGQSSGFTAGIYVFSPVIAGGMVATVASTAGQSVFYLDPAWFPAGTRASKLRLFAAAMVNNTAPAVTYTYGLYPVSAVGGAGGNSITLGAVVAGSTAAIAAPGVNSENHAESGSFTFPSAGFYALGAALSGNELAGAFVCHNAKLLYLQS